jgi:predicted O-linked N-acetylglucosamine transferase (SPINDLY family)
VNSRERLEAGLALHRQGRLNDAAAIYGDVLAAEPGNADALHFLGLIANQRGDTARAADLIAQAVAAAPDRPTFRANLGMILLGAGHAAAAAQHLAKADELEPGSFETLCNLGAASGQSGRAEAAEAAYRKALASRPGAGIALSGLGAALNNQRRFAEAETAGRDAVAAAPDLAEARINLANALHGLGRVGDAVAVMEEAAARHAGDAPCHYNLGNLLLGAGRLAAGQACFERARAIDPRHRGAADNLLLGRLYDDAETEETIFAAHRDWGADFAHLARDGHGNGRDPERRLRVGFVSPDFRTHSCAYFVEPLFAAHDRGTVEIVAYADVPRPDEVTARLRGLADIWRDIAGCDDGALAGQIADDGADILIDLAGHSGRNRLGAFARRPAPVQVSWLGYPATSGLAAIGYRITDAIADPADADPWHTEKLVRLARGFHCYRPPADAPEIAGRPADRPVIFGSFNNLLKVTDETARTWAEIVNAVPGARLLLKGRILESEAGRETVGGRFARAGLAPERLELHRWIARDDAPMALYHEVDIALDPFPYNGTTTTCEALWMGVPVVTLAGGRHAARVGASLLTHFGAPELIARDRADYVRRAVDLARDGARRAEFRATARRRFAASPLRDEAGFARAFEAALREAWRQWCAGPR